MINRGLTFMLIGCSIFHTSIVFSGNLLSKVMSFSTYQSPGLQAQHLEQMHNPNSVAVEIDQHNIDQQEAEWDQGFNDIVFLVGLMFALSCFSK